MVAQLAPLPMFGRWNEHWKNHPAGLPVSQYKPGTNPNTGAQSVDNAWNAWAQSNPDAYNQWYQNQYGTAQTGGQQTPPPASTPPPATTPPPTVPGPDGTPAPVTPPPANPNAGMNPLSGFASRYTPAMMDQVYQNPWYILQDVFSGLSTSSPLYQALRDFGGDPLALYNIMQGSQSSVGGGSEDYVNWLANLYQQMGTPGGSGINAQQLLGAIFGQGEFGADSNNVLGQILGAGDMGTQIRTMFNLGKDVSNVGMNPMAARAYQAALAQAGDRYGSQALSTDGTTGPQNPTAWIRENMPYLTMGG